MKHPIASVALLIAIGTHGTALGGDVTLTLDVNKLPGNRVQLSGKTNLPRGTKLMLSVQEKMEGGFIGQSKTVVAAGGTFTSEAFGPNDGLQDGRYVAEVMMPIPSVQPASVQAIIGENGQNLTGALVEKGGLGVTVSRQAEFVIGAEPDAAQKARKKEVDRATAELKKQLCIYLEQLLEFKDDTKFKQFGFGTGGPYNKWLNNVEGLRDAQPAGSHPIPILLRAAPGDLIMVGMEYMRKGETDYTRQMVPELKDTIDYADYVAEKKSSVTAKPQFRVWRDSTGKPRVEAVLVSIRGDAVVLRKRDGKMIRVGIARLSEEDARYVQERRGE